ncbi:glycoside hydrolase family 2 protein [Zavarzinella formosa]|uniref:glycoside hydrolase family 2 protein n=1 Tax=Zavarzinella formosa TaxID=360055 RepID=UPI0002EADAB5|nr:glycoside hydrolase family 2 TIM barrel-domain containing protein [Zavarzinella formosa]
MNLRWIILGLTALIGAPLTAADWKPAPGPLLTKWGKELKPDGVWKEYPRPQLSRSQWQNLNGLWDYAITPKDAKKPEKWDGQILVPFCVESSLSGVGKTVGDEKALWYHRTFKPVAAKGTRTILNFGAVDWQATIYLNDKTFIHEGGFDPFSFDITEAIQGGGDQELVIRVWDPTEKGSQPVGKQLGNPHGIWYTPVTGIWQTVWLEQVPESYLTRVQSLADIDAGTVTLTFAGTGLKESDIVQVSVMDASKEVTKASGPVGKPLVIKIPDAKRWTPDKPVVYDVRAALVRDGKSLDQAGSYFTMRKISVGKDAKGVNRLMLNNEPVFQYGPLDQGWWPDGLYTPPSSEAMIYDLKVLKNLGMNMLRKHIKVEPATYYEACDRLGFLVWQDMPSCINRTKKHFIAPDAKTDAVFDAPEQALYLKELKAMIDHLSFFSCIVVWVPFNEGWGQHDTNDVLKWTTDYDKTRLVDGPSGWTDRGFGHMKDLHQYPGPGMFPVMSDRVSVLGEFGGLGLPIKDHLWKNSDNWGYQTFKTTEELRQNYHRLMVQLLPLIDRGLSAAVYTQTTDVEVEVNGLMTYDRAIIKVDEKETAKWHKRLFSGKAPIRTVLETSETKPQTWNYTLAKPGDDWMKPEFAAEGWKTGPGGFGTKMTPNTFVGTEWNTTNIWIRREFEIKDLPAGELFFRVHHDEDTEIFINGVSAASLKGFSVDYGLVPVGEAGRKALKTSKNVIAVSCKQTTGGQYIDVGLIELLEGK